MAFRIKTLKQIVSEMIATVRADQQRKPPSEQVTDFNPGSIIRSLIEAIGLILADLYLQVAKLRMLFSLDRATGTDLDDRAQDYKQYRNKPTKSYGLLVVSDKNATVAAQSALALQADLGAVTLKIAAADYASFPDSGALVLDRGVPGSKETVNYDSKTAPDILNIAATTKQHLVGSTVHLSTIGADKVIAAGTRVQVPSSEGNASIDFLTTQTVTFLDGDLVSPEIPTESALTGKVTKAASGTINTFVAPPWPTALVTNPQQFEGGDDEESDDNFRDRIKHFVQTLTRATMLSLRDKANGLTVGAQRVVTAQVIEDALQRDVTLYIHDGVTLSAPSSSDSANPELLIHNADPGERRAKLRYWPVVGNVNVWKSSELGNAESVTPGVGVATLLDASKNWVPSDLVGWLLVDSNKNLFLVDDNDVTSVRVVVASGQQNPAVGAFALVEVHDVSKKLVRALSDIGLDRMLVTGVCTVVGTVATDATKSWAVNSLADKIFVDSAGGVFRIQSNTATAVTVYDGDSAWAAPVAGAYSIIEGSVLSDALCKRTDFYFNETTGDIELTQGLAAGHCLVAYPDPISGIVYSYYTGIVQEAQRIINGDPSDLVTYPGVKASGVKVRVMWPQIRQISVVINIEADGDQSIYYADVTAAIENYINSLGIGDNVIVSEIVAAAMAVPGVKDATVFTPASNIAILATQLARTDSSKITVY